MSEFCVGQKVGAWRNGECVNIGVVKKITAKRKFVSVEFPTYIANFRMDGRQIGCDTYYALWIKPATEEDEKDVKRKIKIQKCKRLVEDFAYYMTAEQADKVLAVMEEVKKQLV